MKKTTTNWNGVIDVEVMKRVKCRIWSKKEFPVTWSGLSMRLINYDHETGIMTANVGNGTFVFHISSVIIQVQDADKDADKVEEEKALAILSMKHKARKKEVKRS